MCRHETIYIKLWAGPSLPDQLISSIRESSSTLASSAVIVLLPSVWICPSLSCLVASRCLSDQSRQVQQLHHFHSEPSRQSPAAAAAAAAVAAAAAASGLCSGRQPSILMIPLWSPGAKHVPHVLTHRDCFRRSYLPHTRLV